MLQQLLSHSSDLRKLVEDGYEIEINGGYILIHHVPYVNHEQSIRYGTLICSLDLDSPTRTYKPKDHTIHFAGETPCHRDGRPLSEIINSSGKKHHAEGIESDHFFSSRPPAGYANYYDKISTYINILSNPAQAIDSAVTARTYRLIQSEDDSVFMYADTQSSRTNIEYINRKFKDQKIAIVGLGGTGSYILDLVSKTKVREIHLYDADDFLQNNAFRSPGAADGEMLDKSIGLKKVDYYTQIYSRLHKGITPHAEFVTEENLDRLKDMSYVFICIDNDISRRTIVNGLQKLIVPFIDTGMGVQAVEEKLLGIIRVTAGTPLKYDHLEKRIPVADDHQNEYNTNIQIADLNALNAVLAVIRWKKFSGFYMDNNSEHHSTFTIDTGLLLNEETTA